ncbi:lantibiotic dehydratase [Flavobacterium sp. JP2137]|uniref:lantibiotic dehydratase n=1 Tax=Flavobacterium sp. JP2137 TaxID=3414510 RepID=UPI003D2FA4F0
MFHPLDFYLVRTPSFPVQNFLLLTEGLQMRDKKKIKTIFDNKEFLLSIYFSSKEFYYEALNWIKSDSDFNWNDKVLFTLYKYYSRMCTRATPYGTFAGFSIGKIGEKINTELQIATENPKTAHVRIDLHFLNKLIEYSKNIALESQLSYVPTDSLYYYNDKIRYIELESNSDFSISEVDSDEILNYVLEYARRGVTRDQLVNEICKTTGEFSKEDVVGYVDNIIKSKILIPIIPPRILGLENPLDQLVEFLKIKNLSTEHLNPILNFQQNTGNNINISALEDLTNIYSHLYSEKLQQFQVDLEINTNQNQIDKKIVDKICLRAKELSPLSQTKQNSQLEKFINKFINKYDQEEIPLVEALDPQYGLGYGSHISGSIEQTPLIGDIAFSDNTRSDIISVPPIIRLVLEKYREHFIEKKPIQLTEEDLNSISNEKLPPVAESYFIFGDILSESHSDLQNGKFKFLCKSSLPTPYMENILSRYAYHNRTLNEKLNKSISQTHISGAIYVEVNHVPYPRIGNVLMRPNNYQYELSYVTNSDQNNKRNIIKIDDIMISVRNKNIILRSKKYQKIIFPKISSAYNQRKSQLPFIQFLGDLENYKIYNGFSWDWSFINQFKYLPRVEYKELILKPAQWRISQDKKMTVAKLESLLKKLQAPKYCSITEHDNTLYLDCEIPFCLELLCKEIKKSNVILFESTLSLYKNTKDNVQFAAEYIIPLIGEAKTGSDLNKVNKDSLPVETSDRHFPPGTQWTYIKIYCAHSFSDNLIMELSSWIRDLCEEANQEILWFYVKYEDPDFHLRLRINISMGHKFIGIINAKLQSIYYKNGLARIQYDTYSREIERYELLNIINAEKIFYYDSLCAVNLLKLIQVINGDQSRITAATISIDALLSDFKIQDEDRWVIMEKLFQKFLPEFTAKRSSDAIKNLRLSLNNKFRQYREVVEGVILKNVREENSNLFLIIETKSHNIQKVLDNVYIKNLRETGLVDTIHDLIHLSMNRLFQTKIRMHELVIYYIVYKAYKSIYERNKKQSNGN